MGYICINKDQKQQIFWFLMKITCLQNAFFYLIFAKLTCQKNYRVARECLRLIDLLLYFPFTTSETKEDFYRQKLNVCVAPVVIVQPETF